MRRSRRSCRSRRPPNLGQTIVAIDATALSGGAFAERIATLTGIYAALDGARLPGTSRLAARERAARDGLRLSARLIVALKALGRTE